MADESSTDKTKQAASERDSDSLETPEISQVSEDPAMESSPDTDAPDELIEHLDSGLLQIEPDPGPRAPAPTPPAIPAVPPLVPTPHQDDGAPPAEDVEEDIEELDPEDLEELDAEDLEEIPPDPMDEEITRPDGISIEEADLPAEGSPPHLEIQQAASAGLDLMDEPNIVLDSEEAPEEEELEEDQTPPLEAALQRMEKDDAEDTEAYLLSALRAEPDRLRKALLQHELGHLLHTRLDDEAQAVKSYALALKGDPLLRPNVWSIRRVFISHGLWPNLLKLLDAQLRFEESPARKADILLEKGWILQDIEQNPSEAKDAYWDAQAANRDWLAPLLALEKLALSQGDLDCLADVYREMAEAADSAALKVAVLSDLAQLQEELTDGTPHQALAILEEAYDLGVNQDAVLDQMLRVTTNAGLVHEQIEILRRQAEYQMEQEEPDRVTATAKLRMAAQLSHHQEGELSEAKKLISAGLAILPGDRLLQQDMLALAEAQEDWDQVEEVLTLQLESGKMETDQDYIRRAALYHHIGMIRMANSEGASDALDLALDAMPGYLPVMVDKERQALANGDIEGLVAVYLAEAQAVENRSPGLPLQDGPDPLWCATMLWRAASLMNRRLGQQERAMEICRHALSIKPDFAPALDELEDLYSASGAHQELRSLLEAQLEGSEPARQVKLLETLINISGGDLDDTEGQLAYLKKLRELRPEDLRTLRRIADALRHLERYGELEQTLRSLEDMEEEATLLAAWKLDRAHLYEGPLDRRQDAIALYQDILARFPDHVFAFASLENLLRAEGDFAALAELLRNAADGSEEPDRRIDLLHRLGSLYHKELSDSAQAVAVASEILALKPDDPTAIRDLAHIAGAADDPTKLVEALEFQIERTEEPRAKVDLMIRLAELLEDCLSDSERAAELFTRAISLSSSWEEVADPIDAMVRRQLKDKQLAEALLNLESLQEDASDAQAARFLEERAWISAGPLGDSEAAAQLWQELLSLRPDYQPALWSAMFLAARQRDAARMAEISALLASLVKDPGLRDALNLRTALLSDVARGEGSDPDAAYRRVLQDNPDSVEALHGLLAGNGLEHDERADIMRRLAGFSGDEEEDAQVQVRLALALAHESAGRFQDARDEISVILEEDEDNLAALIILERLARAAQDQQQEARILARLAQLSSDDEVKVDCLRRAALLLLELSHPDDAVLLLRKILEIRPADAAAIDHLRALYQQAGQHLELEQLLGHYIRHIEEADILSKVYLQRAKLRLHDLDEAAGGARDLLRLLQLDPQHVEALELLARLYEEDGNPEAALDKYRDLASATDGLDQRREITLRMIELYQQGANADEAIKVCKDFLQASPEDVAMLERLSELYKDQGDHANMVDVLLSLVDLQDDVQGQAGNLSRVGLICWTDLKDLKRARQLLKRSLGLDPTNLEVLENLYNLLREMDLAKEVDELLQQTMDGLRGALADRSMSADHCRDLLKVGQWLGDKGIEQAASGLLCVLNAATPKERDKYRQSLPAAGFSPRNDLSPSTWKDLITDPRCGNGCGDIWSVLVDAVPRLHKGKVFNNPIDLGASKNEKVDRSAGGPVSSLIDRLASSVGLQEYDIYLTSSDPDMVAGVASNPPTLVLGHSVVTTLNAARRFQLGRTLALMRHRATALDKLSLSELELLFAAAIFPADKKASFKPPQSQVEETSKMVYKALSRKNKKVLQQVARQRKGACAGLEQWIKGVQATANRAGLLMSGDIEATLGELVRKLEPSPAKEKMSPEEVLQVLESDPTAKDLALFWVSEAFLKARNEIGI